MNCTDWPLNLNLPALGPLTCTGITNSDGLITLLAGSVGELCSRTLQSVQQSLEEYGVTWIPQIEGLAQHTVADLCQLSCPGCAAIAPPLLPLSGQPTAPPQPPQLPPSPPLPPSAPSAALIGSSYAIPDFLSGGALRTSFVAAADTAGYGPSPYETQRLTGEFVFDPDFYDFLWMTATGQRWNLREAARCRPRNWVRRADVEGKIVLVNLIPMSACALQFNLDPVFEDFSYLGAAGLVGVLPPFGEAYGTRWQCSIRYSRSGPNIPYGQIPYFCANFQIADLIDLLSTHLIQRTARELVGPPGNLSIATATASLAATIPTFCAILGTSTDRIVRMTPPTVCTLESEQLLVAAGTAVLMAATGAEDSSRTIVLGNITLENDRVPLEVRQ